VVMESVYLQRFYFKYNNIFVEFNIDVICDLKQIIS